MKRTSFSQIGLVVLLGLGLFSFPPVLGVELIDQQFTTFDTNDIVNDCPGYSSQEFTPQADNLSAVEILANGDPINENSNGTNFDLRIRYAINGTLVGATSWNGTIDADLNSPHPVKFNFTQPLKMIPNNLYWLEVCADSSDISWWAGSSIDLYPGGMAFNTSPMGPLDFTFTTFYTVEPMNEEALGQVNILGTCGVDTDSNNLVFQNLAPGLISSPENMTITNTGTVDAELTVNGTDWVDLGEVPQMLVNNTRYDTVNGASYPSMIQLTNSPTVVTSTFSPSTPIDFFWRVQTNLLDPSYVGPLNQVVDFTVSCP